MRAEPHRPTRSTSAQRSSPLLAVHVIFRRDTRTLLLERQNTGWGDGQLSLVAGHVRPREDIYSAAVREVAEEVGVSMRHSDLSAAGVMHRLSDSEERVDIFFAAKRWDTEPYNAEPEKCARLLWATESDRMRMDVVPYIRVALDQPTDSTWVRTFGW